MSDNAREWSGKPDIVDPSWPRFYFNGNQGWGWIESRADWEWLQKMYATGWGDGGKGVLARLLAARCLAGQTIRSTNFGLYAEHCGTDTLADFFADVGTSPSSTETRDET